MIPMLPEPGGWFAASTNSATAGTLYSFQIDDRIQVPDPASRFQPDDVHGPSEVIDPLAWVWQDGNWQGRPWEETILYELHVGSFTPQGTFLGVRERLDHLVDLGVSAIELMPVADFPGTRNWGYDGTLLFAPDSRYGRPEHLKALVQAAHTRGLMVFLDVVYNHFGPDGNYLDTYAPWFFTKRHTTPWGTALNYDGEHSDWVRQFFIHNALYWLEEYHLDGLRFDAVHTIFDGSQTDILVELAQRVRQTFGDRRHIHLVLENDNNDSIYLTRDENHRPRFYVAQWNDDFHHAFHVLLTNEASGYYVDYADDPLGHLARCLTEGFAYQGEPSKYRGHHTRGSISRGLPPTAFICFLQNHDQVGNRAFGERLDVLTDPRKMTAAITLLLLSPAIPLLFMGQEWGSRQPFRFFCDFRGVLRQAIVTGRREEFSQFPEFDSHALRERIPNPLALQTFEECVLDWDVCRLPTHQSWLTLYRRLLALRRQVIAPRLRSLGNVQATWSRLKDQAFVASWTLGEGAKLDVVANLGDTNVRSTYAPHASILYTTHPEDDARLRIDHLPPWSVTWYLSV